MARAAPRRPATTARARATQRCNRGAPHAISLAPGARRNPPPAPEAHVCALRQRERKGERAYLYTAAEGDPMTRARVAVCGGGPAGLLTAGLLARRKELAVTLIERAAEQEAWSAKSYTINISDKVSAAVPAFQPAVNTRLRDAARWHAMGGGRGGANWHDWMWLTALMIDALRQPTTITLRASPVPLPLGAVLARWRTAT